MAKAKNKFFNPFVLIIFLAVAFLLPSKTQGDYGCLENIYVSCLQESRFQTYVYFQHNLHNERETDHARLKDALLGDATALFYFFTPDNPELMIKIVDACGVNGHYWVYASAATDLKYTFKVKDLKTNETHSYNPSIGSLVSDTSTIPCQ